MDSSDYYSIEAIIADSQKLPCTFALDVPGLGYLDGGSEPDIKESTKAEIPFWLAQTLALHEFVTFTIPPPFSPRVKSALNASHTNVKLSSLVGGLGQWYGFGMRIAAILDDEQQATLLSLLSQTLKYRLPEIQDQAQHAASASGSNIVNSDFRDGMDGEERELFAAAQESARRMTAWYDGRSDAVVTRRAGNGGASGR